mmetsp:Transcript_31698/g.73524  ORF Transcript_31698/g.73524 Transcript_31698/m.73524 type:complete len:457 (-) Transcript_31698:89-1459(-)
MSCNLSFVSSVVAACLLHLTFGTVYCWGNMAPYIVSFMRWHGHCVDYDEMSWAVSVTTSLQAIAMICGGSLHHRMGLHRTACLGCSLMTAGVLLSSVTVTCGKCLFLLTYAGLFGFGMGLAYIVPMLVLMKWLPRMKGLASGIVVAGFGAGACVFNKLQEMRINPTEVVPSLELEGQKFFNWHEPETVQAVLAHVPRLLRLQGCIFAVMHVLGLWMLREPAPPKEEEIASAEDGAMTKEQQALHEEHLTPFEMLRQKRFWILIGNVFFCAQIVLIMAASQKTFGLEMLPGVSDALLTSATGMASLLNGLGRLVWGAIADWTSFRFAMMTTCIIIAAQLGTLPFVCTTPTRYSVWICGIFFCIGGFFALFPTATSTFFGSKHMGSNYGCVFVGLAASELLGSVILQCVLGGRPIAASCETMAALAVCGGVLGMQLQPPKQALTLSAVSYDATGAKAK